MGIESLKRHTMSDYNTFLKRFNHHKRKIKTASYLNSSNNETMKSRFSLMKQIREGIESNNSFDVQLLQGGGK